MKQKTMVWIVGILLALFMAGLSVASQQCMAIGEEPEPPCLEGEILFHYRANGICIGFHICRVTYQYFCFDMDEGKYYWPRAYVEVVDFKCPGGW